MAPVIRELESHSALISSRVCITAQHRQMLDQVLNLFEIEADYDLNLMQDRQTPTQVAAVILAKLEMTLAREQPDWVLVQGDTTTAMAAALGSFYARVKVGHVEAGLRTHVKWEPFPEEVNRKIIGGIADLHFAPTLQARQNLVYEGVPEDHILVTGNPVIDALIWAAGRPTLTRLSNPGFLEMEPTFSFPENSRLILVTAHRRENFGDRLENICLALRDIAERYGQQVQLVYPVHLNPNVQEPVYRLLGSVKNITLIPPLDYLPLVKLMERATLVLTDSGGIQEEAPGLGKPVLVLREVTERPEAVEAGTVRLVGTDRERIVKETFRLLEDPSEYKRMAQAVNPYGDGLAAQRIVAALLGEAVKPFEPMRSII
jgi:UDP-N-acetylglucosamine 2-epimerase (non-hydrolysing)